MSKLKAYWAGELVQTGPDTWEVKHPEHKAVTMARARAKNKAKGIRPEKNAQRKAKLKERYTAFLDRKNLRVVDHEGKIRAENVVITATKKEGKFTQVLVRFIMNGKEYTGKTRQEPANALILRAGRTVVKHCSECNAPVKNRNVSGKCRKCNNKEAKEKYQFCKECGKKINRLNATGLCREHYRKTKEAAQQRGAFNPFISN